MTNLDSVLKSRDITLPTKVHLVKAMAFPVVMYGCESWTIKKAEHWRIDAFELWCWRRLLRVRPLDCKEIQLIHPKGNQSWILIGRIDAKAEMPILWPPDTKSWLIGKDPDAGKYWRQEEKGTTGDEMVGWHHWLNHHEFEQAPGVGDGQGSLGTAVHGVAKNRTRLSNWTELNWCGRNGFRWFHLDWSFTSEYLNIFHGKQVLNCIERCVTNICMMLGTYWSILQASNKQDLHRFYFSWNSFFLSILKKVCCAVSSFQALPLVVYRIKGRKSGFYGLCSSRGLELAFCLW